MNISQSQYLLLFTASWLLVGVLTPVMRQVALTKDILDYPNSSHKSHTKPVPYLGGVAIIIGIVLVTNIALLFSDATLKNFWLSISLLGPALVMGIVGLWDDIKQLPPFPRFIGQTLTGIMVATILVLGDNRGNPTGSTVLDVFISVFWIVGICNSINFFDNLDGGAAGTSAISGMALTYLAIASNQSLIAAISIVLTGATLGFLIWNKSPARIYMGDAGALFLGVLLATLAIRLKPETSSTFSSFATPLLILAVPILDTSVAVISRIRRKVSPFKGGKDHLSHRLIQVGFSRRTSAILLWTLSAFFCFLAILTSITSQFNEAILVLFGMISWIVLFIKFMKISDNSKI